MRILFLVLLLILNVHAEAKSIGSAQSGKSTKKAKTTVVAKTKKSIQKSTQKSNTKSLSKRASSSKRKASKTSDAASSVAVRDSLNYVVSDSRNFEGDSSRSAGSLASDSLKNVVVVRDTVVDTVYVVYKDTVSHEKQKECNVPLPRQSAYLGKGFSVGLGAGIFNASKDCDCLGVWQGLVDFHYNEIVSSGIDIRIFGGTLDRDMMLMYQRYRVNLRFHKGYPGADFYFATLLGLETMDLSEFRKELRNGVHNDPSSDEFSEEGEPDDDHDLALAEKNCEKMFSLDGFTLGVEAGMGLVMFRYLGLVGSASYEFNFSWAQQVTFSPGIAFNLHEVWPWAGRNLRSTWISFEMVFQRYFNRDVNEWAVAGFLGLQFGI